MTKAQKIKSALEIVEEASFVLKHHFSATLPIYYIGALPFVLAFSYFWTDMSHSAFARDHIIPESLLLAVLYVWMKCWHAVYCQKMLSIIRVQPTPGWSYKQLLKLISSQTFISGSAVFIMPLAMITTIPFGWVFAFYQNISMAYNGKRGVKEIISRAWESASIWPGQNHIILSILSVITVLIFFNMGIAVYILPYLLKTMLGIDTVFSLSGFSILNTTFLIIVSGLTYLVVDPLLKAVYTLRYFYVFSVKSGDDIRTDMINLRGASKVITCLLFFVLLSSYSSNAAAADEPIAAVKEPSTVKIASPEEINSSIEKVTRESEFAWRLQNNKEDEDQNEIGAIERFILWIKDYIVRAWNYIYNKLNEWIKKLIGTEKKNESNDLWKSNVFLIMYFIFAVLLCILAIVIWRQYQRKRRPAAKITAQGIPSVPDLTDEYVNPVELPAERWLNMGYDLMQRQSFRLALRAFYLAILSRLAEKKLIMIARYKTNLDYLTELKRRDHEHMELIKLFSANIQLFDRAWYGMHEVTETILSGFISDHERMVKIVNG
ncbi:MAG: DUF4129 domain-containing protein [Deltaproteobacteria bacterium]|nr:DUF4129 domain-containing protein [Deltaproteobacteria bacterium]